MHLQIMCALCKHNDAGLRGLQLGTALLNLQAQLKFPQLGFRDSNTMAHVGNNAPREALQRACELLKSPRFADRLVALLSLSSRLSSVLAQEGTPATLEFRRKIFAALGPEFFRFGLRKEAYGSYNLSFPEAEWGDLFQLVVRSFAVFSQDPAIQPSLIPAMHLVMDALQHELDHVADSAEFEVAATLTQSLSTLLHAAATNPADMDVTGLLNIVAMGLSRVFPVYHQQQLVLKRATLEALSEDPLYPSTVDDCLSQLLAVLYWLLYNGFALRAVDADCTQSVVALAVGPLLWLLQAPSAELMLQAEATLSLLLHTAAEVQKVPLLGLSQTCQEKPLWQLAQSSILQLLAARDGSQGTSSALYHSRCNVYVVILALVRAFGFHWLKLAEGNASGTAFLHALARLLSVDLRVTLDSIEALTMPPAAQSAALNSLPVARPQTAISRLATLQSSRTELIDLVKLQTDVFGMTLQVFSEILETMPSDDAVTASNSSSIESVVQVHQVMLSMVESLAGHLHALQVSDMFPLFTGVLTITPFEQSQVQGLASLCAQPSKDDSPLSSQHQLCMNTFAFLMEAEIALECGSAIASYCSQLADSADTHAMATAVIREITLALPITVCLHDGMRGASLDLQLLADPAMLSNALARCTRPDHLPIFALSSVPAAHIVPIVWNMLLHGPPTHEEAANDEVEDETALLQGIVVEHVVPFLTAWTEALMRKMSLAVMNLRAQERSNAHGEEASGLVITVSTAATLLCPCLQEVRRTTLLAPWKPLCTALQAFCSRMLSPANISMLDEQATDWMAALEDIRNCARLP
jgi:hypothetical protein